MNKKAIVMAYPQGCTVFGMSAEYQNETVLIDSHQNMSVDGVIAFLGHDIDYLLFDCTFGSGIHKVVHKGNMYGPNGYVILPIMKPEEVREYNNYLDEAFKRAFPQK